jgi:hypothetical protein
MAEEEKGRIAKRKLNRKFMETFMIASICKLESNDYTYIRAFVCNVCC